jgi:hypothetical protein
MLYPLELRARLFVPNILAEALSGDVPVICFSWFFAARAVPVPRFVASPLRARK